MLNLEIQLFYEQSKHEFKLKVSTMKFS